MRVLTVARKPLSEPSVAANVLKHGTGALHTDATRIPYNNEKGHGSAASAGQGRGYKDTVGHGIYHGVGGVVMPPHPLGRFPSNIVVSHLAACTPEACSDTCPVKLYDNGFFKFMGARPPVPVESDVFVLFGS